MRLIHVQDMGPRDTSHLGRVNHIRIWADDGKALTWREAWEAFSEKFPDTWAIELFPPASQLVDDTNMYHLFTVSRFRVGELNIKWRDND